MSDSKDDYSKISKNYVSEAIFSEKKKEAYLRSKERERLYGENWKRHCVNINEVVERFTPGARGEVHGQKVEFRSQNYIIKADMASGYLRIWDRIAKKFCLLDGTPVDDRDRTHFKILRREEM